ncbi:MAG TPA: hypothetical protein VF897_13220 [Roseiflexaceae bacterium]
MNINKQPTVAAGIFLIALGLVWWLNLWSLLLPAALLIGGVVAYQQRRRMGRTIEAVQIGLWGVGLALLFMLHFVWPGVLFLAGASVLMRGREDRADASIQQTVARMRRARPAAQSTPTQHVPITTSQAAQIAPAAPRPVEPAAKTGETTRL